MKTLVKKLLIEDRIVHYRLSDEKNIPLNLGISYLRIKMRRDKVSFSTQNIKRWVIDSMEYLNEINTSDGAEEMSSEDCFDEVVNSIMWCDSPFAFDENDSQIPNTYISEAENDLSDYLKKLLVSVF